MQCVVYKSLRQFDYYLFVDKEDELSRLPEGLKRLLGTLEKVVEFDLHRDRALAQAEPAEVIEQIIEQGYYLQMPLRDRGEPPVA